MLRKVEIGTAVDTLYLPEFEKNTEKAAGLFKAMQVIFNFSVVVKTLATYYYSKEKRERTNS